MTPTSKSVPEIKIGEPGRVAFFDGQGEMPMIEITTAWSRAEVYLHGAHVTQFQKRGEAPLLFMSQCSRFAEDQPIRGGIPVIFPWFGAREGLPMHGFARIKAWEVKEVMSAQDGSVGVRFSLPECPESMSLPPFKAEYVVTVKDTLSLELAITNESAEEVFTCENCLHTYFEVGDVTAIVISGLQGHEYLDKLANFARKTETGDKLRIGSEVDRVFLNASGPVEITDPRLGRRIRIEKEGSNSTVVWNPWIAKSQQMPDFGNDEYPRMVCVESANVGSNQLNIEPGATARLRVKLSSETL